MFATVLFLAYCFSLVVSSVIDPTFSNNYVDGKQYTIKSVNTTYTQRVSIHGDCMVELNDQGENVNTITEGEIVKINNKWFKAESCRLNRAYIAPCGSKLFRQIRDFVCLYVEQRSEKKVLKRRDTVDDRVNIIDQSYYGVCCKSACTISELVQYCPSKW